MTINRIHSLVLLGALIGGLSVGCTGEVIGSSSDELLVCGDKDDAIRDGTGGTLGTLHMSNDYDSMQLQIDLASGFTGVKIYLGPPPPPVPFADGDLALSTIEESFPVTTSRTYDIPFTDIGVECAAEIKIVAKLYLEDEAVAWAYSANPDYIYWNGNIPFDYYLACEDSCVPPTDGCTYTMGFWKNHEDVWPTTGLTLGGVYYDAGELDALLESPTRGDASMILAHQLIAAELNVLDGASDADIGDAVADADAWLAANADADGTLPYGTRKSPERAAAITLAGALDAFNNGYTGPGHCD
jgi:hypothetical protein